LKFSTNQNIFCIFFRDDRSEAQVEVLKAQAELYKEQTRREHSLRLQETELHNLKMQHEMELHNKKIQFFDTMMDVLKVKILIRKQIVFFS